MTSWNIDFLDSSCSTGPQYALIILNQSFSLPLLQRVWHSSFWRSCADGGANRLYDLLMSHRVNPRLYLPDLIEGDLDSLRCDVKQYYASQGVPVIRNDCQDSTDLMKCVYAVQAKEQTEGQVKVLPSDNGAVSKPLEQYDIVILGGLAGRLDQTIHTLSFLHKLRRTRKRVYVVTDDNVGWVLDSGEHHIHINHSLLGETCGLLPVGIDETTLTTTGLRWNLTDHPSSFDGLVSTSNHLVPNEPVVWIKTSKPIWWTVELRPLDKEAIVIDQDK